MYSTWVLPNLATGKDTVSFDLHAHTVQNQTGIWCTSYFCALYLTRLQLCRPYPSHDTHFRRSTSFLAAMGPAPLTNTAWVANTVPPSSAAVDLMITRLTATAASARVFHSRLSLQQQAGEPPPAPGRGSSCSPPPTTTTTTLWRHMHTSRTGIFYGLDVVCFERGIAGLGIVKCDAKGN